MNSPRPTCIEGFKKTARKMSTSQTNKLTDEELTLLAQQFSPEDFEKLSHHLGFSKVVGEPDHGSVLQILTTWRDTNSDHSHERGLLQEKLHDEFPKQAVFLRKDLNATNLPEAGVDEEFLVRLAEEIRTDDHVDNLARNLGFKAAAIERYRTTNLIGGRKTYRGTLDMLYDWRDKTIPRDQRTVLKKSLIDSGMARLAEAVPKTARTPGDVYSLPITDNLTVHGCREKLMDLYKKSTCKIQLRPWDKEHTTDVQGIYTIVTMVKKDREGNELKRVVLKGSVHDIFSAKVDGMLPDRILLLAPAGKGKTTAVAKLAYDWIKNIQGSPLQDLPLLFVLRLRNVDQMMSLGEAIISQLLDDVKGLTSESIEEFIEKNQEKCHIVMDGLDEYAGTIREEKGRPGNSLVQALQYKSLRNCRILVTTRPHLEEDFDQGELPLVYAKMEIEGFTPENVTTYIDKFFSYNKVKSDNLKLYLDKNEVIKELTSVPFFTMMVCHLWSENLLDGITTQTALFDNVNTFFRHHLQKKGRELPDDLFHRTIVGLGKVALSGLLADKNKLVFTPDDFKDVSEAYDYGIKLGIISSTTTTLKHVTAQGPTTSTTVEFYHKLAQEHAAGKYLATTYKERWSKLRYSATDNPFKKIQKSLADYENLLRFAAGARDIVCVKVLKTILGASSVSDEEKYRILLDCSSESTDLSDQSLDLVRRCIGDGAMILQAPTVHTAVGLKKLPYSSKQQINRLHILTQKMKMATSHKLASSIEDLPNLSELLVKEKTSSMMLKDGCLEMKSASKEILHVFAGLRESVVEKIWRVDITGNNFCGEATNTLPSLTRKCSFVNELNINVNEVGNISTLMRELHPDLLSEVKTLRIHLHSLPKDATEDVALALGYCKSLDAFHISTDYGSGHEFTAKMYGSGIGEMVLTNPSDDLLTVLTGLHENTRARIWQIRTSTPTLPLPLANKIASFAGMCPNMNAVDVHVDELAGENSQRLELLNGVLHMKPLNDTFQTVVAGFHERTLKGVTDLKIQVPRMSAPTEKGLGNSIGRCVNITKMFVDADGDDLHAVMRKLHKDTLSKVMKLDINLKQLTVAGIENLAPIIGSCSRIRELNISSLNKFRSEEKFLTLKDQVLTVQSPKSVHPVISNLHPDVLQTVGSMKIFAEELSPSVISNLSSSVGQCSRLTNLKVCSPVDEGFQRDILDITDSGMSWNPVSKEFLPIISDLPQILLDKIRQIHVISSDLPEDLAQQLVKTIRMFSTLNDLTVNVIGDKEGEMLSVRPHNIKLTCVSGQLLPVLAGLKYGNRTEIQGVELLVPRLTNEIAYHVGSVLEAFVQVHTVSVVVAHGTARQAPILLKSGHDAVIPLSPPVLPLLERLHVGILGKVKSLLVSAPMMTEEVKSRLKSLSEMFTSLQAVTLNSCLASDAEVILTAFHKDVVCKIKKLHLRCNDSSKSFDDKLGYAIGRFPALDEFSLESKEDGQPCDVLRVKQKQLMVKGPGGKAVTMATSLHHDSLDKVKGIHIAGYLSDEPSTSSVVGCIDMCSNIHRLALDVSSSDDVKGFIRRLDENSLSKIEHLQVLSPDLPTQLALQLSYIDKSCPNLSSVVVAQRNEERQDHGPPIDLPMVYLQGDARLTIRLSSEAGEVVLVKTRPMDIPALLEGVQVHTLEEVQLIMVSAPSLTLSVSHKLASVIGQCASIRSLFICFEKGTSNEASVSIDRHYLRLKNMSSSMFPVLAGLSESMKDGIHTLKISESTFQPECSHHWPFIASFSNLTRVAIERSFLKLHGLSPSLLSLIERCRKIESMRLSEISIWQCGTVGLDRLESYVESLIKTDSGIAFIVENVTPRYTLQRTLPYA